MAIGRSILVIVRALLSDADARLADLGADDCASRTNPERRVRLHVEELQDLDHSVTLDPAA